MNLSPYAPAARRAARTFIQTFLAVVIAAPAFHALGSGTVDWSALKTLAVSATGAGIVALVSFLYNAIEQATGVEVIGKN